MSGIYAMDDSLKAKLESATLKSAKALSFDGITTLAKAIKIYDSDTITIAFPFKDEIYKYNLRLNGIDAPEIKSKIEAEVNMAKKGQKFLSDLILNKLIKVKMGKMDKYQRILADIFLLDDTDIIPLLLDKKFVRPYSGDKKADWSPSELDK